MQIVSHSMRRSLLALVVVAFAALLASGCGSSNGATSTNPSASPDAVAWVNGEPISQAQLDKELNKLKGREVLQTLIEERLIQQAAKKDDIKIGDAEVKARLEEVKSSPQYAALARQGVMSDADLEDYIRRLLLLQKLILLEIPETDKLRLYDQFGKDLEQAHVYHIVVDGKKKADADKVVAALKAGKDFAALAQEYSLDQDSKSRGGELGWLPRSAPIQPNLAKAIFSLPVNQISEPIKTEYGWHVVKVTGRKRTYDELKTDIQDRLVAAKQAQYVERLRVKADIKTKFDSSPTPAASGSPAASPAAK